MPKAPQRRPRLPGVRHAGRRTTRARPHGCGRRACDGRDDDQGYDGADSSDGAEPPDEDEPAASGRAQSRRRSQRRGPSGDADDASVGLGRRDRKAAAHRRRRRRVLLGCRTAAGRGRAEPRRTRHRGTRDHTQGRVRRDETADGGAAAKESATPSGGVPGVRPRLPPRSPCLRRRRSPPGQEGQGDRRGHAVGDRDEPSAPLEPGPSITPSSAPSSAPSSRPPASSPTPHPSPTKTCNRFLWWCT